MSYTMLCLVLLAFTLLGRCRGDSISTSPKLLLPPVPESHRMSNAQVVSLRRQLMRDNYDYQHSSDETQPKINARRGGDSKFNYQKGRTDDLPRAPELAPATSNAFSAESGQQEHYSQSGQFEQLSQNEQGRQHDQPGEYEHRGQYEQPSEHEQRGQYQQPDEHEQRGLYDQRDQHEQHGPHKQRGQHKRHGQLEEREQREQRGQNEERGPYEQREQNEQQEQLGQSDEQEQAQSIEQIVRVAPSLDDAPDAPPVAVPLNDKLTVGDVSEREYTPNQRDIKPSYYNKRPNAYVPSYASQMERRPFSDLRGNNKEQYEQHDAGNDMRAQEEMASNAQESPDQEYTTEEQETFDQQDASGSQDDEGMDVSVSKKQPKIHKEFVTRSTTRANRLQHYTPAPAKRNAPPHRVHNSLTYLNPNSPLHRNRNEPPTQNNAPDHNIAKKDLLYYMDDSQLRRRKNEASADIPDEDQQADDQLPSPQPSPGPNNPTATRTSPGEIARRPTLTVGRSGGEPSHTSRAKRSFVVTVSAANVTYKLLRLKSRSGRRQDERRILEERGPSGVAIISLDHAPLPAFRLPRARRQYMHAPRQHRHHKPA